MIWFKMIRQEFNVRSYWKVVVFYSIDYHFFNSINRELVEAGFSGEPLTEMWYTLIEGDGKAVTCSDLQKHLSYILFNPHESWLDYLNSLVHEAEHVKEAMLEAYDVENKGETPAYTIGYLVMRMWKGFRKLWKW